MVDVQLDRLIEWYVEKTGRIVQPVERNAWAIVGRVREAVYSLKQASGKMASKDKGKPTAGYASMLAEEVFLSIEKVEFPQTVTFKTLQRLHKGLVQSIDAINEAGRKYVPRMKSFKAEVRALDSNLKRLTDVTGTLGNFIRIDYTEAKTIENVRQKIEELRIEAEEAENLLRSMEKAEKVKKEIEEKLKSLNEPGEEGRSSRLMEVEDRLKETGARLKELFNPLEKPMEKTWKLIQDGDYMLERDQKLMLEGLLSNPFQTFLSIKSYESFKALLNKVEELIESGKLELKKKRKEKALAGLRKIAEETTEELRRGYEELQREKEEIESFLNVEEKHSERKKLKMQLDELNREISEMTVKHNHLKEEYAERRKLVEEAIAEIVKEEIRIIDYTCSIHENRGESSS